MFLHSVAGMHPHEFSAPLDPTRRNSITIPRRSPLTRAAFSSPIPRTATSYEKPVPILQSSARTLSEYIPRTVEHNVRFQELGEGDTMSEDGRSVANSEGSEGTANGSKKRRRRSTRTSTALYFAHPAPTATQNQKLVNIRPKLIFQLQRLLPGSRPKPAIDVLPATVVATRLAKKFPLMFTGKTKLGVNDVMIMKSEDYDAPDPDPTSDSDDDELSSRELVAVICQIPKTAGGSQGKVEITLHDGSVWLATPSSGWFEFACVNQELHRMTFRWAPGKGGRKSADLSATGLAVTEEIKFTFSMIDPSKRRHPIMATLTQNMLDIPDSYTSVSSSAGRYPPTSPMRSTQDDQSGSEESIIERTTHIIDDDMKLFIQTTAIWVALRQGFSPHFQYTDSIPAPNSQSGKVRNGSQTPDSTKQSTKQNPANIFSTTPESNHSSLAAVGVKILRTCTKASPSSTSSQSDQHGMDQHGTPKRTMSNGSVFMQRAMASRKVTNPPSTIISDSEGEAIFTPPRRAVTDDVSTNTASHPLSTNPSRFDAPTPETPTRAQRRVHSMYVPLSSTSKTAQSRFHERHSFDGNGWTQNEELRNGDGQQAKPNRWKFLTNLFRPSKKK